MRHEECEFVGGPLDGRVIEVVVGMTSQPPKSYTVPAGESIDVRATAMTDMSILLGADSAKFLGSEVASDAYSNFDASVPAFEILDAALHGFGAGIVSTGRQGAGVYINLDQAMRLGHRVAALPAGHTGVVGRDEYSTYQEKVG